MRWKKSDAPSLFSSPDAAKLFPKMVQILVRFRRCSAVIAQNRRKFCSMAGAWPRGMEGVIGGGRGYKECVLECVKIMGQTTVLDGTETSD